MRYEEALPDNYVRIVIEQAQNVVRIFSEADRDVGSKRETLKVMARTTFAAWVRSELVPLRERFTLSDNCPPIHIPFVISLNGRYCS